MTNPPEKADAAETKALGSWKPETWMFYAATAAAAVFLVWAIWTSVALGNANQALTDTRTAADKKLNEANAQAEAKLREAQRLSLQRSAQAVARSVEPFMALKGQVPEITDRSFQSSVRNLVQDQNLRFVAIADAAGRTIASSDLTLIGRPLNAPTGVQVETAQIGEGTKQGTVMLGMAP